MLTPPTLTAAESYALAPVQQKLAYQARQRNGINWFFWIAGLSLVNSAIFLTGGGITFVVGLAFTQFVDAFMALVAEELGMRAVPVLIAYFADIVIAAVFVGFGFLGRKGYRWVVVGGMAVYALDAAIFVWLQDWLAVGFHAWALWGLWQGLQAINGLRRLEADGPVVIPPELIAPPRPAPFGSPRTFRIFVIVAVGVAVCLLAPILIVLLLPNVQPLGVGG